MTRESEQSICVSNGVTKNQDYIRSDDIENNSQTPTVIKIVDDRIELKGK